MDTLLAGMEASTVASNLRTSTLLYPAVSALHILGVALLVGSIVTLDMRVAGILRPANWREAVGDLGPVAATGLALALMTGALLFAVRAGDYAANPAMLAKWGLILFGLSNIVVFHALLRRSIERERAPPLLRVTALFSAIVWVAALIAGRWIAFAN